MSKIIAGLCRWLQGDTGKDDYPPSQAEVKLWLLLDQREEETWKRATKNIMTELGIILLKWPHPSDCEWAHDVLKELNAVGRKALSAQSKSKV